MQSPSTPSSYRWYILFLGTITNALVVAAPSMSMPVLFPEIAAELNLSLVQVGVVWGISSLPGIITVLLGGAIGDKVGPRKVLILTCLAVAFSGALRGLSNSYFSLLVSMLLFGAFTPFITNNNMKNCSTWFPQYQLGLASGVLSMGMALGFLIGSMFSATTLSPLLGGWRGVLYLYGAFAALLALPWFLARSAPPMDPSRSALPAPKPLRQAVMDVAKIPTILLLGLMLMGVNGCIQGTLGYLPTYLRGQGWEPALADGALAAFHTTSLVLVIPIALLSDRLGTRRKVLLACGAAFILGISMLAFTSGPAVWAAVLIAGMVRDGFMAVLMTMIIETDGVGAAYAGSATGIVMVFSGIGSLLAPPIGNSLGEILPQLPFLFWAFLTLLGMVALLATKEHHGPKAVAAKATP